MNNFAARHPEDGQLLCYLDGELPARKARQVRRHLEACWQCRAEIESLETTVADCMRYRKHVLEAHLPAPPNAWRSLDRDFARIDAATPGQTAASPHSAWAWRWALAGALAVLAVCGVYYDLRETPSVQAAALLRRAVAAADAQPKTGRRIRIRTRTQQVDRTIGLERVADARAVYALFAAAHYDSADPLSAKSYQHWRDGLPEKQDEVATVGDRYQIRTTAPAGAVAVATLLLRAADLTPVEGRLEFRDKDWLEFSEITEPAAPGDGTFVANNGGAPARPAVPPSRPAAVAPGPSASISSEMRVLSALHGIGADLGDPVEVSVSDGRVMVMGVGVSPQRQTQIHAALDGMPKVAVRFAEPVAAAAPLDAAPAKSSESAPDTTVPARLATQLGGRAEVEKFSSQILEWEEAAMARAYALRALAQRFPANAEGPMNAEDRQLLLGMAGEHASALAAQLDKIQGVLAPVLVSFGAAAPAAPQTSSGVWQASSEDVFRASRRVEVSLSLFLGVTPDRDGKGDSPSELLAAVKDLRAAVDQCRRLIARDGVR